MMEWEKERERIEGLSKKKATQAPLIAVEPVSRKK